MCGIAFISSPKKNISVATIEIMTSKIKHRGPDGEGFYVWGDGKGNNLLSEDTPDYKDFDDYRKIEDARNELVNLALGHRRLSIIDVTAAGHQPMWTSDGKLCITFNGEIYNYKEIRAELSELGVQFFTGSDTEVLVESYRFWGEDCLLRFNGMFSFIIWDEENQEVFGARDRFGIKPMYYHLTPEGVLYASSEIKQIIPVVSDLVQMNQKRVFDYLVLGQTDHTNDTMFKNIFQVPGGMFFKYSIHDNLKSLPLKTYYDLEEKLSDPKLSYEEAVKRYKDLFNRSVELRLRSDVPVGTCLSGGLDSSSILSTMLTQETSREDQFTSFSNCSHDKKYDEQEFIDCYSGNPKLRQLKTFPNIKDLLSKIDEIIYTHEEPFLSTSVYAEWSVFELVSSDGQVKVTLDGHGADEQLIGYHNFLSPLLGTFFNEFRWLTLLKECIALNRKHAYSYSTIFSKLILSIAPTWLALKLLKVTNRVDSSPSWFNSSELNFAEQSSCRLEENTQNKVGRISIEKVLRNSIPKQLKWSDRNSMKRSVESRVPFLDHNLVEFTLSLPIEYRYKNGVTKRILRDAMKGVLPDKIRMRMDKMGYVTPEEKWFKEEERNKVLELVQNSINVSQGLLTNELISYVIDILDGKVPYNKIVWRAICLGKWIEVYDVKK